MPFTTSGKARLWYAERGSGNGTAPTVVLVHGGLLEPMDGMRFWIAPDIADALAAAGFRVLIPDRRFSGGRTVAPIEVHSWDVEAHDLLAILDAANIRHTHIIAGSNGVSAAIRFARSFPDRVLSLTFCWPSPPDNDRVHALSEHARSVISQVGPAGYVDMARAADSGSRPSLILRHVLQPEGDVANDFARLPAGEAVRIVSETEHRLLAGDLLRGVSSQDLERLGASGLPIAVMPADPEDRAHTRAITETLASGITGSTFLRGTPVSPSPVFPAHRDRFTRQVIRHLRERSPAG